MIPTSVKYVVISPVRDEQDYIEQTIRSMLNQTIKPCEWVIVNDGSEDETRNIVDRFAAEVPWIKTVHRRNRGYRKAGAGVVEAFYEGYELIATDVWDFIVKLDGDLSFDSKYFELCFKKFQENEKLGIGGGDIYHRINGRLKLDKSPRFHVRGATKIYRRACWEAIGGLLEVPGWDSLDELKANMLGWQTYSFNDLKLLHHRFTGSADGCWKDSVKNGVSDYISGYHPLYMFFKCLKRMKDRPYIINAVGHAWGFIRGYAKGIQQVKDPALICFLRQQQLRKLTFRKTILK